jgi:hypothetical protein
MAEEEACAGVERGGLRFGPFGACSLRGRGASGGSLLSAYDCQLSAGSSEAKRKGKRGTSLACSRVNVLGLIIVVVVVVVVEGVGSVVAVVVVMLEESKRELVSTLGELDRVLYTFLVSPAQ